ncbi:hypothetical protein Nepgr_021895 [Nepenthes gracilis]|uniref:Transmembrane protein n=1 Tax=Nepenthes gracilis TaxID=150966 RepID=A0AAD3XXI0_NEPGR|nr:hypothetical protein Nepgr_021895 [Nepenthes gracilis]
MTALGKVADKHGLWSGSERDRFSRKTIRPRLQLLPLQSAAFYHRRFSTNPWRCLFLLATNHRERRGFLIMSTEQKGGEDQHASGDVAVGWGGMIEERYRKLKEHAETYPYVWASYIVVYGGFALWTTYRWRKLRKTEDRVRALQERLRKLVEAEGSASSASSAEKAPQHPVDKPPK